MVVPEAARGRRVAPGSLAGLVPVGVVPRPKVVVAPSGPEAGLEEPATPAEAAVLVDRREAVVVGRVPVGQEPVAAPVGVGGRGRVGRPIVGRVEAVVVQRHPSRRCRL